jgi:DNA (cytosine-5)-methyltransferase 1
MDVSILSIGLNKGALRVWLQGRFLARAGFNPRTFYEVEKEPDAIVLKKVDRGFRVVSARVKNEKETPIIDLNSAEVLSMFSGLSHVKVIFNDGEIRIQSLASEARAKERFERTEARIKAGEPLQVGSLAHGGGVLSLALHTGLARGGLTSEMAFANEMRADLTEQSMTVNEVWTDKTIALCGKMQDFAFDEEVMRSLPQLDCLEAGLPCNAVSLPGRVKGKLAHPETHPLYGHLALSFCAFIARVNPTVIVLEQVVPYASSASMDIIRNHLADLQYDLHETIIDGSDWNALEPRKRMLMVAVTKGIDFALEGLEMPAKRTRTLGEILEPIPADDPRWKTMQGLKDKEIRDKAAGKSFAMQIFDETSEKTCTLTAGMTRNRSTDMKIRHPDNPDLLRIPTPQEHASAKQISPHLIEGLSDTVAHQLLGQSIIFEPFVAIGKLIAERLKTMKRAIITEPPLPLFA